MSEKEEKIKHFTKFESFYKNRTVGFCSAIILSAAVQGVTNPFISYISWPVSEICEFIKSETEIKIEKKAVYKEGSAKSAIDGWLEKWLKCKKYFY